MPKSSKSRSGKGRVTVKNLPKREKKLTKKEAKSVKGGIIAVLIGHSAKDKPAG
jgi:hypothetical protein